MKFVHCLITLKKNVDAQRTVKRYNSESIGTVPMARIDAQEKNKKDLSPMVRINTISLEANLLYDKDKKVD